ncbi:MAG: MMPL family transporter [Thermomicrobiales bacterium]|nr:MMPL family transporter [Thermomicrobiales bacterium]
MSLAKLARTTAKHPWWTILAWVIALVAFSAVQGILPLKSTGNVELLNNPESVQGWDALIDHGIRAERPGSETIIVRSADVTVDDPSFQQAVQGITDGLRADAEHVAGATNYYEVNAQDPNAAAGFVSADRKSTIIPVTLAGDYEQALEDAPDFLKTYDSIKEGVTGFEVMTVGDASLNEEINEITETDIARGESIGGGIAFLILIVVFGALVAAFVPIILAVLSIGIALGLTALYSQFSELSFFVTSMISMIGLAVGIDYSLFIVQRYREERRHGMEKHDAIALAGSTATRAVVFSGITVIIALAGMLIVPNNIYRSLAIGAIFVVAVAVIANLTLLPAVISLLGNKLDWPRRWKYDAQAVAAQDRYDHETIHSGFWGTITRVVMGHPVIALVGAAGFLVLCALPYFNLNPGLGGISQMPDSLESKQAYIVLANEFSAGLVSPVEIVVVGDQNDPAVQAGIAELTSQIGQAQTAEGGPLFGAVTVEAAPDGGAALLSAPLKVNPDDDAGYDAIAHLREDIVPGIESTMNGAEVLVTGVSANNADFFEMRDTYTPIVFVFVLGLSFLLLMTVFRSVVVAAKAIAMNLLSVGAAYGLLVWVVQEGNLTGLFGFQQVDAIEAWLPLFLFSVLFGLSMDYHVFLLSRIREHYDQSTRNAESVAVGLQATAKIITGAALIMVAVFSGFASGQLTFMQQMGFGLGVAVLLDATIVRSILVPAAMALLGDRNWYLPSWLHWLPDLRVEGAEEHASHVEPAAAPAD